MNPQSPSLLSTLKSGLATIARTIGWLLVAAVLVCLSLRMGRSSFDSLAGMRELERIPATTVRAVLPGEVNLNGQAQILQDTLKAPNTQTPCVYYRYHVERREKDSDGDTKWVTVSDSTKLVPFLLQDATAGIRLVPDQGVNFSVPKSWSTQEGDMRYTEYRIDPGDALFVFGVAVRTESGFEVVFNREGHYQPIISELGETRERVGMAGVSIAKAWFGLVALALALTVVISILRQHRLLVYFTILNLAVTAYLVTLGLHMMELDLQAATERLDTYRDTVQTEVQSLLSDHGIRWNGDWDSLPEFSAYANQGLSEETRERLSEIRLTLARSVERVRSQRLAFPEVFLAPLWDIPVQDPLPLPGTGETRSRLEETVMEKARIPPLPGLAVIGGSLLVGIFTFQSGFRRVKFKRCMENIPTSLTTGASYGITELKGEIEVPENTGPLISPLTHQPCVQFFYKVEEKRRSGKKTRWVTLEQRSERMPFLCRDREGTLEIDPDGADIHSLHKTVQRKLGRRYTETRLGHGDPLYAIGECRLDPVQGDRLRLSNPEEKEIPFILSNLTESQVMLRIARTGILYLNASFAGILLTALLFFGLSGSFAATDYLTAALTAPLFMTCVTLVLHYNDLVFLRERVRRNRSNIEVSLQKRSDLVHQLENITRGLMQHERELLESSARMRNSANLSQSMEAGQQFLQKFMMLREDMPDLKANTQLELMMRSLILLENEISLMRTGYNDAVETYNSRIQTFPDLFFARLFNFEEASLILAETEVVRVPPALQSLWKEEQESVTPGHDV